MANDDIEEWNKIISIETDYSAASSSSSDEEPVPSNEMIVGYKEATSIFTGFPNNKKMDAFSLIGNRSNLETLFFCRTASQEEGTEEKPKSKFSELQQLLMAIVVRFIATLKIEKSKKDDTEINTSPLNRSVIVHDFDVYVHNPLARMVLPVDENYSRNGHRKVSLLLDTAFHILRTSISQSQWNDFEMFFSASDQDMSSRQLIDAIIRSYKVDKNLIQRNIVKSFRINDLDLILFEYACLCTFGPLLDDFRGDEFHGYTGYPCLDALVEVGFHNVRSVRDTSFKERLYVCLMSASYLETIFFERTATKEGCSGKWQEITVYFPATHDKTEADMGYFFTMLVDTFSKIFQTKAQRKSVLEVCLPPVSVEMKNVMRELFPKAKITNHRQMLDDIICDETSSAKRSRN